MANESSNPLEKFLAVPGAKTTLPVSAAKEGFSKLGINSIFTKLKGEF